MLARVDGEASGLVSRLLLSLRWLPAGDVATELASTLPEPIIDSPTGRDDAVDAVRERPLATDRPRPRSASELEPNTILANWTASARRSRTKLAVAVPQCCPAVLDVRRRASRLKATGRSPSATLRKERSRSASKSSNAESPSRRRRINVVSSSVELRLCSAHRHIHTQ